MSVKSCNRSGCDNMMCDTYVEGVGYICNQCQEEFKVFASSIRINNESYIPYFLKQFMNTEKSTYKSSTPMIDAFFASRTN